jgi:hypothetical protein
MTKSLDASSAPEAGELHRFLQSANRYFGDVGLYRDHHLHDELEAAERALSSLLLKLAETEKRLAETDAVIAHLEIGTCSAAEGLPCPLQDETDAAIERHALRSAATSGKGEEPHCESCADLNWCDDNTAPRGKEPGK